MGRRLQNKRSQLREAGASDAEQTAAKQPRSKRAAVGEALTELQLLTDDPRVLELAARAIDITYSLHEAHNRADRDRRAAVARAAHNAFVRRLAPARMRAGRCFIPRDALLAGRPVVSTAQFGLSGARAATPRARGLDTPEGPAHRAGPSGFLTLLVG
ncbi:hypothetical protein [Streptomyces mirabilis]|uniref:hypothetical protein n=1 Tax=Streptomyces mirabilis TaxID=68239 RepID=UPI00331CA445